MCDRVAAEAPVRSRAPGGVEPGDRHPAATDSAAVTLRYVEDLPIAEIASILEAPAGTIKSDLSRARDHLRTAITGSDA